MIGFQEFTYYRPIVKVQFLSLTFFRLIDLLNVTYSGFPNIAKFPNNANQTIINTNENALYKFPTYTSNVKKLFIVSP